MIASEGLLQRTASYLLGMPLLADYLEDGLSQFSRSRLGLFLRQSAKSSPHMKSAFDVPGRSAPRPVGRPGRSSWTGREVWGLARVQNLKNELTFDTLRSACSVSTLAFTTLRNSGLSIADLLAARPTETTTITAIDATSMILRWVAGSAPTREVFICYHHT